MCDLNQKKENGGYVNDRDTCCDGGTGLATDEGEKVDRWISATPVLEAELPGDVQASLSQLLDRESVTTLGEWVDEVRRRTGGEGIEFDDFCHAGEKTDHRGDVEGETYHFICFYDAVALAVLTERPVDIRTKSPDGTVVEAHAVGTTDLTVTPEEAVFSFGVERDPGPSAEGSPLPEDIYSAVCPYVKAFPDRATYEQWAERVPAATVAMPLEGNTDIAAALVE